MLIEKIAVFILFIGILVFFHELGHFFFARLFGVRVETFSIGFGPKILKYKYKDTVYAVSAIPLGGYVKMFGDDPFSTEELSKEEEKVAFNRKGKWARFWIVFGGPLANFILAFVLYSFLFSVGEEYRPVRFGKVTEKSMLYQKGIRTADTIFSVNGKKFRGLESLGPEDSHIKSITVLRDGNKSVLSLEMNIEDFFKEYAEVAPILRKPIFVNSQGKELKIRNIKPDMSLEEFIESKPEIVVFAEEPNSETEIKIPKSADLINALKAEGYYPLDLQIDNISMNSAALTAGLKAGYILDKLNGKSLTSFEDLRLSLQELPANTVVDITYLDNSTGKLATTKLTPEEKEIDGKKLKLIGVQRKRDIFITPKTVKDTAYGFGDSIVLGFERTIDGINSVVAGFVKLFTSSQSLKSIGGPIAIGQVASEYFKIGLTKFLSLMALMSINLGVLNLFPIPVLDGGHILFIFVELLNRGPLSKKKMQIAMQIGFSFLIALTFLALFNDVSRLFS